MKLFLIIATRLAGLSALLADATFTSSVNTLVPHYGPQILATIGIISILATDVLHAQS